MIGAAAVSTEPSRALGRTLARWALALMLATVVLSAYMRLAQQTSPCPPGPACIGGASAMGGVELARGLHRLVATGVLGLAIALVVVLRRARPSREHRLSLALMALVLALALLGLVTPGARVSAVAIGNLIGGFAVVLVIVRLAQTRRPPPALHGHAVVAVVLLLLQAAIGVQLSASSAAGGCDDASACVAALGSGRWDLQALDPLRPLVPGRPAAAASAMAIGVHAGGAALCAAVVLALAWRALRAGAVRSAGLLAALVALQLVLGLLQLQGFGGSPATLSQHPPMGLLLAHNLAALGLLVLAVRLFRFTPRAG